MDENLTREERIRKYAYGWYEFRQHYSKFGTPEMDWFRAEHMVDAEDKAEIIAIEDKFKRQPSRMRV